MITEECIYSLLHGGLSFAGSHIWLALHRVAGIYNWIMEAGRLSDLWEQKRMKMPWECRAERPKQLTLLIPLLSNAVQALAADSKASCTRAAVSHRH